MTEAGMTEEEGRPVLTPEALGPDPLEAARVWWREAEEGSGMRNPNAVCLSTVTAEGQPDGRTVLLKDIDERGFQFFTNYASAKGRALEETPRAAFTFYWDRMGRQLRVRGGVEKLPGELSDAYFRSRPRISRVGAWASEQSRPLSSRKELEERVEAISDRFPGEAVPRPPHWGGFRLVAEEIEFWQEGPYRLHDRLLFTREGQEWSITRLFP